MGKERGEGKKRDKAKENVNKHDRMGIPHPHQYYTSLHSQSQQFEVDLLKFSLLDINQHFISL